MEGKICSLKLENILTRAYEEQPLSSAEVIFLLGLKKKGQIAQLFRVARELRYRYFGKKVFL